jgi:hypothetical protein
MDTPATHRSGMTVTGWGFVLLLVVSRLGCTASTKPADTSAMSGSAPRSMMNSSRSSTLTSHSVTPNSRAATPTPVGTTKGDVVTPAGVVLPDPRRTPGAINPAVTEGTMHQTICVAGWTATIRPPSGYTTALKQQQLATGYAYDGDRNTGDYEEDHLISLELGGSPRLERNLWPEPYLATDGARMKDQIENKLHALVCDGALRLATAQQAIAANWYTAYCRYLRAPVPTSTHTTAAPVSSTRPLQPTR